MLSSFSGKTACLRGNFNRQIMYFVYLVHNLDLRSNLNVSSDNTQTCGSIPTDNGLINKGEKLLCLIIQKKNCPAL